MFHTQRFVGWVFAGVLMAYLLSVIPAFAQGTSGIVPLVTNDPISEYLTKGGSFAVIFILLFFYRRDWRTAVDFWKDQHKTTTELVQQATKAQTDNSAAIRENSMLIARLSDKIK